MIITPGFPQLILASTIAGISDKTGQPVKLVMVIIALLTAIIGLWSMLRQR